MTTQTKELEDATLTVVESFALSLKECRTSSTMHAHKDGYDEVSSETKVGFHWKLQGIAAKLGMDVVRSDGFKPKDQETYSVIITSHLYDIGFSGFKSREEAIRNALAFAERNGLKVDGYKVRNTDVP